MAVDGENGQAQSLEVIILGQIRDNMTLMSRQLEKLNDDVSAVKVDVAGLKASDIKADLEAVVARQTAADLARDNLITAQGKEILEVRLQMARYQGIFMPLAVVASALLSVALSHLFK